MNNRAFWMNVKGEISDVSSTHIAAIIKNPEVFGFTAEQIRVAYQHYDEHIPQEGKARGDLIEHAIKRGWIRLRWYRNACWSITVAQLDHATSQCITAWAQTMLTTGIADIQENDPYMPVKFVALRNHLENKEYTVKSIAVGALLSDSSQRVVALNYVKTFKEFLH